MNPTQPTIQEPIRYQIKDNDEKPKIDRLDPMISTPIGNITEDTIKPYGYEDTKEFSWR